MSTFYNINNLMGGHFKIPTNLGNFDSRQFVGFLAVDILSVDNLPFGNNIPTKHPGGTRIKVTTKNMVSYTYAKDHLCYSIEFVEGYIVCKYSKYIVNINTCIKYF
jgi:hypothetical protein